MSTETMQPFHPSFTIASNTNFHNNNAYYTAASETDPNNYLLETFHQYPHGDFRPTFYNPFEIKHRRRTSRAQLKVLEKSFSENPKPNATVRRILAQKLDMTPRGVQIWFQNRRAKAKLQRRKAAAASNNGEAKPEQQQQEKNESSTTGQQQQQQQSESIEQSVLFSQFFANVPAQHEQTGKPAFTSYMPPKTTQRPIHNNDCVYGWPQERADSVRSVATAAAAAAAAAAAYDPHTWLSVPVHPLGFDDMMTRRGSCPVTTTTDFSNPLELNWDPAFDIKERRYSEPTCSRREWSMPMNLYYPNTTMQYTSPLASSCSVSTCLTDSPVSLDACCYNQGTTTTTTACFDLQPYISAEEIDTTLFTSSSTFA